jgi:6-phosphogluconolactonase/glucosamine-6-phosphate isomerase/deaminase
MESGFKSWCTNNPAGIIIALMGIGRDGHTAGIMRYPDDERLFDPLFVHTVAWVVGYDAGSRNPIPLRVTVTVPFIRDIDHAVVYVSGPEKKQALCDVMAPRGLLYQTPGRILHTMKHCLLFTDLSVDKVKV